jgi:CheY-like chemotaxis protein
MKKYKILLVDDNRHFLDAFEFMLTDVVNDFIGSIHKVNNGEECIKFLEQMPVDLVFMDLDMPGLNGIEATKRIVDKYRFIHIIAVSFHNDFQAIRDMVEAGARNYLIKEEINRDNLTRIFSSL